MKTDLENVSLSSGLPENRPFQVVGLGENAVDWVCRVPYYPEHDTKVRMEHMLRMGGGQIATACSLCARFGLKTKYVGRVGDDDLGEFARKDLKREPMEVLLETVPGAGSHLSLIIVDHRTGGRTIVWERDPALQYREGDLDTSHLGGGQILHLDGNDLPASIEAATWAKQEGMKVCLDIDRVKPRVDDLLRQVDFLIPNTDFAANYSECGDWKSGLRKLALVCPGFIVVTRGEKGAAALWEAEIFEFPAYPVQVVDSTGAGDIFHGAFIYGVLSAWNADRCIRFANAAGALACTKLGARGGIPALEEVLKLGKIDKSPRVSLLQLKEPGP